MFTTAVNGQFSHQKRFRVFVHFQLQDVLFVKYTLSRNTGRYHCGRQCGFTLALQHLNMKLTETNIVVAKAWENILNERTPSETLRG